MGRFRAGYILFSVSTMLLSLNLFANDEPEAKGPPPGEFVRANYTKYEYRIPMRDGKKLFTAVYVPKDDSQKWPFMMSRTPYSVAPYGPDVYKEKLGPSEQFEKNLYIFVYQDVRGRFMSEGTFVDMTPHNPKKRGSQDVDNSSDTYDTIEFLLNHVRNNNGKVGLWGISYPGFYTAASIIDSHPAIKAASPQAPMIDLYFGDDAFHNGVFRLGGNFPFFGYFKEFEKPAKPPKFEPPFDMGTPDAYEFFLRGGSSNKMNAAYLRNNPYFAAWSTHTTYDDYWKERNLAQHLKNIKCAVLTVGGWFDAEDLAGPFSAYHAIGKENKRISNSIAVGPWVHGGWARGTGESLGDVRFNAKTSDYFNEKIQFPFFEHFLKGKGKWKGGAHVFETGTNVWREYEAWPPSKTQMKKMYLHGGGKLSFEEPENSEGDDSYTSDPKHPVPFTEYISEGTPQRYMVDDQRFASRRPDVLTYQTEPLEEDVTLAGPITPELFVSITGTDSDFVVKVIDVYPNDFPDKAEVKETRRILDTPPVRMGGFQQLLRGEPMRTKFRNSFEKPEPMVPGKTEAIRFQMPDVNHTFRRGHKIMVQIQSSWFPVFDLNPQTFTDIPSAKPEDFKSSVQRVFHSKSAPSLIEISVLSKT